MGFVSMFIFAGLLFWLVAGIFYFRKQKDLALVFLVLGILAFCCIFGLILAFSN